MWTDSGSAVAQTVSQLIAGFVMVAIAYVKTRDHITKSAARSEDLYKSLENKFDRIGIDSDDLRVEALRESIQNTADEVHRRVIEDAEARHAAISDVYEKNLKIYKDRIAALEKIVVKNKCRFSEEENAK